MTTTPGTAVAPTKPADITLPTENPWAELEGAFDDGSEKFQDHFGLTLPRLRSDFGRNGKGWVDDLTGEVRNTLDIVLLAYPPSRQFWIKGLDEGPSGPPDCRSMDMDRPTPDSPAIQSDVCATCRHSQWATGEGGERIRPHCQESVNVIAYDTTEQTFVWLRFAGTGLKPFRNYISALKARRRPAFSVVTHVDLEQQSRDRLEWLTPKFSVAGDLTPQQVMPMRDVAKTAMEAWQAVAAEMATAEAERVVEGNPDPFPDDEAAVDAEVVDEPDF